MQTFRVLCITTTVISRMAAYFVPSHRADAAISWSVRAQYLKLLRWENIRRTSVTDDISKLLLLKFNLNPTVAVRQSYRRNSS